MADSEKSPKRKSGTNAPTDPPAETLTGERSGVHGDPRRPQGPRHRRKPMDRDEEDGQGE